MQIYVNNTELDARLTDESNMAQVYEAVSKWTQANRKYIIGVEVDHQILSPEQMADVATANIERVDFKVGDEVDMMLDSVAEMDQYVERVGAILFERNHLTPEEIQNLKDGTLWISQIIRTSCAILRLNPEGIMCPVVGEEGAVAMSVQEILGNLAESAGLIKQEDPATVQDYLADLRDLRFFILKLKMQLMTLNAGLEELLEVVEEFEVKIPSLVEEIVQINAMFQSGQDFQALENLDNVIERLNSYLSAMFATEYRMVQEKGMNLPAGEHGSFQAAADAMTTILKDLSSAMEQSDIVALGDILEYEMTEKLKQLRPFLGEMREILVAE
ncbi:MAG: hypothetical protein JNM27_17960 [Leptospirales bacterium]|nr:hypothetical protein [Leptospirales bacterium]